MHAISAAAAATTTAASTTASTTAKVPQPRLVRAAHEFEAQMMKELLKPMTGKDALSGEDEEAGDDTGSNGSLADFASEALGQALSLRGGFGIADSIIHELSHSGHVHETGKVISKLHGNTANSVLK